MTEKQIKVKTLALLKRARRWFTTEDRLPLDWRHMAEDRRGHEVAAYSSLACRRCIVGGSYLGNPGKDVASAAHNTLLYAKHGVDLYVPHSLAVVHRIYDRAIRRLEKELAQPAPRRSR